MIGENDSRKHIEPTLHYLGAGSTEILPFSYLSYESWVQNLFITIKPCIRFSERNMLRQLCFESHRIGEKAIVMSYFRTKGFKGEKFNYIHFDRMLSRVIYQLCSQNQQNKFNSTKYIPTISV